MTVPLTIISFTQALCIAILTALVQSILFSTILTKLQRLGEKKMNFQEKQGVPAHAERRNHNFNPIPIMVRIRGKGESLEKKCLQEK